MKFRIKKVKQTDGKIQMIYEKQSKHGYDEYSFVCSDQARPEFYSAFTRLAQHVIEMCELPESYLSRITVKGVSYSWTGEPEVMGAVISSSMQLENSYQGLNINTPHKAADSYNDNDPDPMQVLSEECIDDLINLLEECQLYIDGERAQGKLFDVA